jgi:ATP phosphoribosyltransferase
MALKIAAIRGMYLAAVRFMEKTANKLRLGLPKGSLQEASCHMLARAGWRVTVGGRSYVPSVDDPELEARLIRAQEISRYVEHGMLDCGLTGYDWIVENNADVIEVADLIYAKQGLRPVRWVLAVPEDSPVRSVKDLEGKRIATEAVNLARQYLRKHGVKAEVEFSWGATEVKPPVLADAIVDVSETGSSLRANSLRVLAPVLESTPRFIANPAALHDDWKRRKMERMLLLLRGAIAAIDRVGLMMNVPRRHLAAVLELLPALQTPTVSTLTDESWVAINTVIEEHRVRELIPRLAEAGARGIVEYPLSKIVA